MLCRGLTSLKIPWSMPSMSMLYPVMTWGEAAAEAR